MASSVLEALRHELGRRLASHPQGTADREERKLDETLLHHALRAIRSHWAEGKPLSDPDREIIAALAQIAAETVEGARRSRRAKGSGSGRGRGTSVQTADDPRVVALRRARDQSERSARRMRRLQELTTQLASALEAGQVAEIVIDEGSRSVGAHSGALWLLDPSGARLRLVRSRGYPADTTRFEELPLDPRIPIADALIRGEPVWVATRAEYARRYPESEARTRDVDDRPTPAIACLPLTIEGRRLGSLAFTLEELRFFDPDERAFLVALSHSAALALERARLFEAEKIARAEAEAAHRRTSFLLEASVTLSSSLDSRETLERLVRLAVPRMADWCAIDIAQDGGAVRPLAVAHALPDQVALAEELRGRFPTDPGCGLLAALHTGRPELCEEITEEVLRKSARDPEHLERLRQLKLRSGIVVPMVARGRVFGAITFAQAESGRRFGPADLEIAELLARRAGIAIDNSMLFESEANARGAAHQTIDRILRLQRIAGSLAEAMTLEEVSRVVVEEGFEATAASTAALWFIDENEPVARLAASRGVRPWWIERYGLAPLDSPSSLPVIDAIRTQEPVWIEAGGDFARRYPDLYRELVAGGQADDVGAIVPLVAGGRALGALAFGFPSARRLEEDDRAFLLVLARFTAQTIQRARLYQTEREAREAAERAASGQRLLADAGAALAGSLEWEAAFSTIARLCVGTFATWCVVDVLEESGAIRRAAVLHEDLAMSEKAERLLAHVPGPRGGATVRETLETGESRLVTDGPRALVETYAEPERADLLRELGFGSFIVAPLVARGRVIGAISFVRSHRVATFRVEDQRLAEEIASRTALAMDNARLFREAQETARAREEILGVVSHDLKSPLSVIITLSETLLLHSMEPDRLKRSLDLIRRNGTRMARLIDDLMDLAGIQARRLAIHRQPLAVADLVQGALESFAPQAEEGSIRLQSEIAARLPVVDADRERIVQVLSNLLSNALKVSSPGGVITVRAEHPPDEVVLSVTDTGPGIDPDELPHLFERYWRSSKSPYRGTGLGLAIAKGIIEAHGGRIWAASVPGAGSTFFISLPAAA